MTHLPTGKKTQELLKAIRDKKNISVFGMPFCNRLIALSQLNSFLYVCRDYSTALRAYQQLKSIRQDVVYIPPLSDVLLGARQGGETHLNRLKSLFSLAQNQAKIAVTPVLAYMQLYPLKDDILINTAQIKKGCAYNINSFTSNLIKNGYKRVSQLDDFGQFALRGDILDISPVNLTCGVRIDFFDDLAEKIRFMDIDSQLALQEIDEVKISPATEVFLYGDEGERLKNAFPKKLQPQLAAKLEAIYSDLRQKIDAQASDQGLNFIKPLAPHTSLASFVDAPVIFDEGKSSVDAFNAHLTEHHSRLTSLLARGEAFNFCASQLIQGLQPKDLNAAVFDKLLCQNRIFTPQQVFNFDSTELNDYSKNKKALIDDIKNWLLKGFDVSIFCGEAMRKSTLSLLSENNITSAIIKDGTLLNGACFNEDKIALIGAGDLAVKRGEAPAKTKREAFFQPKVNEYVVHPVHGIGLCQGLKRMRIGGAERDYVAISYEGGDTLYVAAESMDIISAYAGEESPQLNRLGGVEFARLKEKAKKAIKEMAFDLKKLYAEREKLKGHAYNPDNSALSEFEADFPYEETPCQLQAAEECIKDLTSGKIMDRLLCGDVGYGKTEVAMRAVFKVVTEGKQAAFISPTTILARQHYQTLQKRMGKFGVEIVSLTRFDSDADIKKALQGLKDGTVDVVCGTHRALSKDVAFKDLGLLVLDEEQRFGVADKEKIKTVKASVSVLTLSATPIPRTLHMAMSGIRDISVLTTPPPTRIPVCTFVSAYSQDLVFDAVNREVERGGQVFIVYNRVETIEKYADTIIKLFPALKIGVAHGQMEKTRLENAINDFAAEKTHILVTSTIIENGIDLSNVNTMIVVDADRLGLSQLYQLRGRIGRGRVQGYAFFTFDGEKILTENAYKRLDAITSYTELGSGFKLAMRDLEIRGAGNILGREQHGHMTRVGYDMYLKLIGEVMDEIGGADTEQAAEVKVNIDFPAFIPESYIDDIEWRLKAYKKIAGAESQARGAKILEELKDVYGNPPLSVKNLVTVAVLKNLAQAIRVQSLTLKKDKYQLKFKDNNAISLNLLQAAVEQGFSYSAADASLFIKPEGDCNKKLMKFLAQAKK